jgi:hypothetical protein
MARWWCSFTGTAVLVKPGVGMEYDSEHKTPIVMDSAGTCFGNTQATAEDVSEGTFGTDRVLQDSECLITILDEVEAVVKAVCAKCPWVGTPVWDSRQSYTGDGSWMFAIRCKLPVLFTTTFVSSYLFQRIRHSRCSTKLIKYRSDLWSL